MTPCRSRKSERLAAIVAAVMTSAASGQLPLDVASAGTLPLDASGITSAAFEAAMANQALYLQTYVNGVDSHMISPYRLIGGSLYGDAGELRQLGFRIDESQVGPGGQIELSRIPGLVYRLDSLRQVLEITASAEQFEAHRYDGSAKTLRPTVSPGVALNYDAYVQATRADADAASAYSNQYSAFLDMRAFAAPGSFIQTGLVRHADPEGAGVATLRLDSTLFRSDPDRLDTLRAGDLISGASLTWVTPVRLGGVQWQRNFRLQPNLVTFPVPTVSGSAAVPSTVDVFVNNVQQYSREVEPGPFTIDNTPSITGQGEIRVVVRDAQGREQATIQPFYAAPNLLKPGLTDFSVETGFLRRNYAVESNDYDQRPSALTSVRAGVTDWLTVEAHAEGTEALANGGLGSVIRLGSLGVISASAAASTSQGIRGSQWGAGYQWSSTRLGVSVSTQRGSDQYVTLANAGLEVAPTREISQASVSTAAAGGGLSAGYVLVRGSSLIASAAIPASGTVTKLGTVSYSTSIRGDWSVYASVFRDFGNRDNTGASLGISYFLGRRGSVSLSAQVREDDTTGNFQASQPLPADGTGSGWRVQGANGASSSVAAAVGYRFEEATLEVGANDSHGGTAGFASLRGSVVSMDYRRWPLLGNSIYDGFALVDTGEPNIGVMFENRPVGRSNHEGLLLIPNLTAQTRNEISIDARDVPIEVEVSAVREVAVPLDRGGVLVKFPVARADTLAVALVRPGGEAVPLGAEATLNDGASFLVGYDGVAYLRGLVAHNMLYVEWADGACRAEFDYRSGTPHRAKTLQCKDAPR